MRSSRLLIAAGVVAIVLLQPSCGGIINLPTPRLKSISPSSASAGGTGFTLTVNGSGFAPQSVVEWNGLQRATTFLSEGELTAAIPVSDIANPGTATVAVFTPAPGGGVSNALTFTINPVSSPVPQLTALSPSAAFAGGAQFTLTLTGSGFVTQSVVTVNGSNRPTAFVNSTTVQTAIQSGDIAVAGSVQVAVVNPPPGGGASNTLALTVSNPAPVLDALAPASAVAGAGALTLQLNGSGFDSASIAQYNGTARTTTFASNTQLTIVLSQADLAAAGTVPVFVTNPMPGGGTSAKRFFSVTPSSTGAGLPVLVDVANDGTQANNGIGSVGTAGPAVSSDGRFIVFASVSNNLVANDANAAGDVFLRDSCLGTSSSCQPTTTLVSLTQGNAQANGPSAEPALDTSGRFAVFTSTATNVVSNVTLTGATHQMFLRETCAGLGVNCVGKTTLISISADGLSPANSGVSSPAVSPDGRFVAFVSAATNLVANATTGAQEIFLRDTCQGAPAGCTPTTYLVSVAADGTTPADGSSSEPDLVSGATGQFVSFTSTASNLVAGAPGVPEVYRRTLCVGISSGCTAGTQLLSTPDGTTFADGASGQSALSSDGRFVTIASTATNLGAASGGVEQVYFRDTCLGVSSGCTAATKLVSVATDGTTPGNGVSERPRISTNGQIVAFASQASNLVTGDTNGFEDVFARNLCTGVTSGCTIATMRVSVAQGGGEGNGNSVNPALAGNGKFVSFLSFASNLVAADTNNREDIFLATTTF